MEKSMLKSITRKRFLTRSIHSIAGATAFLNFGGLAACSANQQEASTSVDGSPEQLPKPAIARIKMATIGATDLTPVEDWYTNWLGYLVAERGEISEAVAASWGTPNMTGRPYILMQPEGGADVYIRAALIDGVAGYSGMTTFGWNSFEIIVDDVYALNERLEDSPFDIIGPARSLGGNIASIHAMQVIGPMQEVLYLACETGDREISSLPIPSSFVDRVFIVILAGPDAGAIREFYTSKLAMSPAGEFDIPIANIARAQNLPEDHLFPLKMVRGTEHGNSIEIDGYPDTAGSRARVTGQLPPGNAMVSFSVNNLDQLDVDFITPPVQETSLAYSENRSASFMGPAGEITEIIEELS